MKKILLCIGILTTMIGASNLAYADALEKGTRGYDIRVNSAANLTFTGSEQKVTTLPYAVQKNSSIKKVSNDANYNGTYYSAIYSGNKQVSSTDSFTRELSTRMDYNGGYHGYNLKMAVSSRATASYDAYVKGTWCAK